MQQMYNDGIFPDILKLTKVIPILEKGNINVPDNCRPICQMSVFV